MSDEAEWGPWQIHDGKGCPCVGQWVQVETDVAPSALKTSAVKIQPNLLAYIPLATGLHRSWHWIDGYCRVVRYRMPAPVKTDGVIA